ncbi:MAG: hypothetical protein ABIL09_21190 [Gemmatimonadota bacterium]
MDALTSFSHRLTATRPYLAAVFAAGLGIAVWDPQPKLILTVALGISVGMLLLGPYAAAALYTTRLQHLWGGHLRWPLCLVLPLSAVIIMDYFLSWKLHQLVLGGAVTAAGTVLGHDASLAVLELRSMADARTDVWMVLLFPLLVGSLVLAGYCSLGFAIGLYHAAVSLLG